MRNSWIVRLVRMHMRKPWYGYMITDRWEIVEKSFWTRRGVVAWCHSFGRDEDGTWRARHVFMWGLPRKLDRDD